MYGGRAPGFLAGPRRKGQVEDDDGLTINLDLSARAAALNATLAHIITCSMQALGQWP